MYALLDRHRAARGQHRTRLSSGSLTAMAGWARLDRVARHVRRPPPGQQRHSWGSAASASSRTASADHPSQADASSALLPGMGLWMDVMRDMEHLYEDDYEVIFDAWQRGGVVGLVIGPLVFDAPDLVRSPDGSTAALEKSRPPALTFDADPAVYEGFGVSVPHPDAEASYFAGIGDTLKTSAESRPEQRKQLHEMLAAAKQRGFTVMIFQAQSGAPDDNEGTTYNGGVNYDDNHHLFDLTRRRSSIARIVDTMQQFPEADGFIWDGPEWGYEIDVDLQGNGRSYIFDLPEELRDDCRSLGYDYDRLRAGMDILFESLHDLDDSMGSETVLTALAEPRVAAWLTFRKDALTNFFHGVSRGVKEALAVSQPGRTVRMGLGTRSAAFAPLCGYDLAALASGEAAVDILMPKHYFYHRGFDGLVGTIARYCRVLCEWNRGDSGHPPRLSTAGALGVVQGLFGLELPGVTSSLDFESVLETDEFYSAVVGGESAKALAAVDGDASRVVPWVDSGRLPHDGDPMTAGQLRRIVVSSQAVCHCL